MNLLDRHFGSRSWAQNKVLTPYNGIYSKSALLLQMINNERTSNKSPIRTSTPTTKTELYAWWAYFVGYEPISAVVLAVLMPLLTEGMARAVGHISGDPTAKCPETDVHGSSCVLFHLGSFEITSAGFTYLILGLSAFAQAISFISVGALADYGNFRKRLLALFTVAGVIATCSVVLAYKAELFWLIACLVVLINMFSGMTLVFYNSYLPLLTQNHPDYLEAVQKEAQALEELEQNERHTPASTRSAQEVAEAVHHRKVLSEATVKVGEGLSNWISTIGFMSGYAAALILVGLCAVMLYAFRSFGERLVTQLCIVGVGLWWGAVSGIAIWKLEYRPGPPLSKGANYIGFSWAKAFRTLSKARQLPHTFRYLICYFFFSDGFNTLGAAAVIFCKFHIDVSTGFMVMALAISLVFAIIGNFALLFVQRRFSIRTKSIMIFMLIAVSLLPVYGAIGLVSTRIGLRQRWEVIPMSIYYGTFVGAMQSFSRVLFADLIPEGEEAEFFSLYAITDKGSSWIGPSVVALIDGVVDGRYGLLFLALLLLLPLPLLIFGVDPVQGKTDCVNFNKQRAENS